MGNRKKKKKTNNKIHINNDFVCSNQNFLRFLITITIEKI